MKRVPATVITGFLGAGKTSLVRHLLAHALAGNCGRIGGVAAAGDGGAVDHRQHPVDGGAVADLGPGEGLHQGFRQGEAGGLDQDMFGRCLAVEKPGQGRQEIVGHRAAEAAVRQFDGSPSSSTSSANWGSTVTPALAHDEPLAEVFADQLACADLAILNKTDLLDRPRLAAVRAELEALLRPGAGLVAARPALHDLETGHDHDDFASFVFAGGPVAAGPAFLDRLRDAIRRHGVLRVKGFVALLGVERRQVVQAVGDRLGSYFDRPWAADEERATRLVVIGGKGLDRAAIEAAVGG